MLKKKKCESVNFQPGALESPTKYIPHFYIAHIVLIFLKKTVSKKPTQKQTSEGNSAMYSGF